MAVIKLSTSNREFPFIASVIYGLDVDTQGKGVYEITGPRPMIEKLAAKAHATIHDDHDIVSFDKL